MNSFDLQPILKGELVSLIPLRPSDFEELYKVASDPLIWEQHPNKDRWKREVFLNFFEGAIKSGGAYLVRDAQTNEAIGCTRFYDYNPDEKSILIGYTFYARRCWGKPFNQEAKKLMMDHAFNFVDIVHFHIGAHNIRSQKAIEKIGAKKTAEIEVAYFGEPEKLNFVYSITKELWILP